MQEALETGDALLAGDISYIVPKGGKVLYQGPIPLRPRGGGEVYVAYPSASLPRFLVPMHDAQALRFVFRVMSADRGLLGVLIRALLVVPGGVAFLRTVVFRECVVVQHYD